MIQVQNLAKSFHNQPVVRNLSFTAPDGAITGLLGANGAGKTTTLRMICGVLQPDSGSVTVDAAATGALLDHIGIYPRLTVRENLAYFGMLRGMPPALLAARVSQVLATLGLDDIADRRTAGFSQGERMKTALGRAILHAPKNLLLDEPTNGLDVPTVRSLRDLLRRLRDAGACVLLSSHVLEEVRALCDQVVIVDHGRLVAQGSPADLCRQTDSASLEDAFVKLTIGQASWPVQAEETVTC
ncbi:MAG: ATP-binding cassette domain-containing protein [Bryobacteraceae bacterium]|jgi:sodium transport system ATP-binding protein